MIHPSQKSRLLVAGDFRRSDRVTFKKALHFVFPPHVAEERLKLLPTSRCGL